MKTQTYDCKNSSGKIIGKVILDDEKIIVKNNIKPELIIDDPQDLKEIYSYSDDGIKILYDKYFLITGEIAAIYRVCYATINKKMKKIPIETAPNQRRRNSSFGIEFSEERKRKIGEKSKGRVIKQYERTPEIRAKISESLKQYYINNPVSDETRKKLSQAWVDGKYKNSPMGTGIHGYYFSIKNNKRFYFRSLLELFYMIQLEKDQKVQQYQIEPFQIPLNDSIHHYTPDFLINNKDIIELKPSAHLNYTKENIRFAEEIKAGQKYAQEHNMTYQVIYDTDLNYDTRNFKRWLINNSDYINSYQISFDRDIYKWS